jgi:phage I-like protein
MKRNPYSARVNASAEGIKVLSAAAVAQGVRQGEPLPSRMRILPWGETRTTDGDVMRVNAQTAELLPGTQREMNWPHAHIDIEHATVPGTPLFKLAAQDGKFPAVLGWGTPLVIAGEGLFVDGITWTPQSKRAYEFPDVSGVVKHLADGTVTGLHSFAFCCHGKGEGCSAFSALIDPTQTEDDMDKLLMALLGLDANADEAAKADRAAKLGAALQALLAAGPEGAKSMSALLKIDPSKLTAMAQLDPAQLKALSGLDAGKLKALSALTADDLGAKLKTLSSLDEGHGAALTALGKRLDAVEGSVKPMAQDFESMRRTQILSQAAAKGKAVPEAWLAKYGANLAVLSDMIDGLPEGVVSLSQASVSGVQPAGKVPSNDDASKVAAIFGRKPEDLKGC